MAKEKDLYAELGVDAGKKTVREAFGKVVDNDYPGAFVNIVNDPEYPDKAFTQHMDGDGSKFVQRLLVYKETGDICVIRGAVDDALVMNLGDIAASGFVFGLISVTDVINIRHIEADIPKDPIMDYIALRFAELREFYRRHGFDMYYFLGGETADLPDQVINGVFDVCVHARAHKQDIVKGNVKPGDKIYGFSSIGQANWEYGENSGIMSNGLTLGRACLMWHGYNEKYPFLTRLGGVYQGRFLVGEFDDLVPGMSVSDALISPTRHWPILIRLLLEKLRQRKISHMLHGISMNTGGGATKIGHVGAGIKYIKKMPEPPGVFKLIQRESGDSWRNMYKNFNCGFGIDVVGEDDPGLEAVLREVEDETNVGCKEIGYCEEWPDGGNKIVLDTHHGRFDDY